MARLAGTFPHLGLDSACLIYLSEVFDHPRGHFLRELMAEADRTFVTSTLCLAEYLVKPHKQAHPAVTALRESIVRLPRLQVVELTADIAQEAARIRAATGWKLPDAVAVATAIIGGADAFLTNDRQLTRADSGLDILILDDLLDP